MIPFILGAVFIALLIAAWMWHAKQSDPASYASSSGFALFEDSLTKNKV